MARFTLEISYAQVSVFDAELDAPFNDWTDEHIAQGFAWRPGSVSFGTLDNGGALSVQVFRTRMFDESASKAERVIAVPFTVPKHGAVEVASIGSSVALELPPGEYELTFEHGRDAGLGMWANLYFRRTTSPALARIIRADAELSPTAALVMTAQPA